MKKNIKKIYSLVALMLMAAMPMALTSCSDDDEPDNGSGVSIYFDGAVEPDQTLFPYETTVRVKSESSDINMFYASLAYEAGTINANDYHFNFRVSENLEAGKELDVDFIEFANSYDITGYYPGLCDSDPTGTCKVKSMTASQVTLEFKDFKFVRQYSTGGFQKYKEQNMTVNGEITFTIE